jgi:hypothetical protein
MRRASEISEASPRIRSVAGRGLAPALPYLTSRFFPPDHVEVLLGDFIRGIEAHRLLKEAAGNGEIAAAERVDATPRAILARQNEAKQGTKVGMAVGGAAQRRSGKQQAAAASSATDQAYKSCLMGRGYSVQ